MLLTIEELVKVYRNGTRANDGISLEIGEGEVFGLLGLDEAVHVDELVEKSELTSSEVLVALYEMEMKGIVRQMPGKQFIKVLP